MRRTPPPSRRAPPAAATTSRSRWRSTSERRLLPAFLPTSGPPLKPGVSLWFRPWLSLFQLLSAWLASLPEILYPCPRPLCRPVFLNVILTPPPSPFCNRGVHEGRASAAVVSWQAWPCCGGLRMFSGAAAGVQAKLFSSRRRIRGAWQGHSYCFAAHGRNRVTRRSLHLIGMGGGGHRPAVGCQKGALPAWQYNLVTGCAGSGGCYIMYAPHA